MYKVKSLLISILVVMAIAITPCKGLAFGNAWLHVSADINDACRFEGPDPSLNFGWLDVFSNNDVTASTTVTFSCTNGAAYTITADNGSHAVGSQKRMVGTKGNYMNYTMPFSPISGIATGPLAPQTFTIEGTIYSADYKMQVADHYTDIITFTITP